MIDFWPIQRLFKRAKENGALFFGDLFHDLWDAFKEVFYKLPRECWYFVKTIYKWTPILWGDRSWDWCFMMKILQFKLKCMRECIVENNIIADAAKIGKQIKQAEDMIDKILDDDFCTEEWKKHEEKWGELHSTTIPIPGELASEWRSLRLNVKTKEDEIQERKEFKKICSLENKRKLANDKKLFNHLCKYYRDFWD